MKKLFFVISIFISSSLYAANNDWQNAIRQSPAIEEARKHADKVAAEREATRVKMTPNEKILDDIRSRQATGGVVEYDVGKR